MLLIPTRFEGVWTAELDRRRDERGWFARAFCRAEAERLGIDGDVRQVNLSYSARAGTLRGVHFQYPPADETKVVRAVAGAVFDVVVDLRPESPTFLGHLALELSAANGRALVVPARCAHGFITLTDDVEMLYLMSRDHSPADEGGLRFDDPDLAIEWPHSVTVFSERDAAWPPLRHQRATIAARMAVPSLDTAPRSRSQGNRAAIQSATIDSASRR